MLKAKKLHVTVLGLGLVKAQNWVKKYSENMVKEAPGTGKHSFPIYMSPDVSVVLYLCIRRERNSWGKRAWGGRVLGDGGAGRAIQWLLSQAPRGWRGGNLSCKKRGKPGERWPQKPFGNRGRSFLTVHDESTWEVRGLKGDGSIWARRSHMTLRPSGRRGSFFSYCLLL